MTEWIIDVSRRSDARYSGGKFDGLARLAVMLPQIGGGHIPPTMCWLSTATSYWFEELGFGAVPEACELDRLRSALVLESMPRTLQRDFTRAVNSLLETSDGIAVRSSAPDEDGMTTSFAGMYRTTLGVRTVDEATVALRDTILSAFEPSVLQYRRDSGFDEIGSPVAVVIQSMVDARSSGVILTEDSTRQEGLGLIECVQGLGEPLVTGIITPSRYHFDRASGRIIGRRIQEQDSAHILSNGAVEVTRLQLASRMVEPLRTAEATALTQVAMALESRFGYPLDIEWAADSDGQLIILQARPLVPHKSSESNSGREP